MSEFAIAKDGTRIGYEQHGEGPAVILVAGANHGREPAIMADALAEFLAE